MFSVTPGAPMGMYEQTFEYPEFDVGMDVALASQELPSNYTSWIPVACVECLEAELGYQPGDVVYLNRYDWFAIHAQSPIPFLEFLGPRFHARVSLNPDSSVLVSYDGTGGYQLFDHSKWRLVIRVYWSLAHAT